jgi:hypothetical protein
MDNHVSRAWLESLSSEELIKIADTYGIDIPPGLERIFIIEEILECSTIDEQEPKNDLEVNPSYTDTALLPKQYNISFIEVLIRDPLWVFVFWEIKGHDRETHENAPDFNGYFLRVIPLEEKETEPKELPFTVSIDPKDSARYLGFTSELTARKQHDAGYTDTQPENSFKNAGHYIIKLGVTRGNSEIQIAASQPFYLPKLNEHEAANDINSNPLIRLSGTQDLQIIKYTDRHSRIKRQ